MIGMFFLSVSMRGLWPKYARSTKHSLYYNANKQYRHVCTRCFFDIKAVSTRLVTSKGIMYIKASNMVRPFNVKLRAAQLTCMLWTQPRLNSSPGQLQPRPRCSGLYCPTLSGLVSGSGPCTLLWHASYGSRDRFLESLHSWVWVDGFSGGDPWNLLIRSNYTQF